MKSPPPIRVSPAALHQFESMLGSDAANTPLLVEIAADSQAGYRYYLGFLEGKLDKKHQMLFVADAYRVVVYNQDLANLRGTVVGYDGGFRFDNPNVRETDPGSAAILSFTHPQPKPRLKLAGPSGEYVANEG